MRTKVHHTRRYALALAAAVIAVSSVGDVAAHPQRRGGVYIPPRPASIASTPMIEGLEKALKALSATESAYDGHREKAITHISAAIRFMELPNAGGRSNEAVAKAIAGKPTAETAAAAATPSQASSDAALRKALSALFTVHHELTGHASTAGRIRADSQVRIAIQELGLALKVSTPAAGSATTPRK